MSKIALIIGDVQNDFCPGGALAVPGGDEVVPVINELLASDRFLVVATQDWHPKKHCSFKEQGGLWPKHCVKGTRGAQLKKDLESELIKHFFILIQKGTELDKDAYSGFEGKCFGGINIEGFLRQFESKEVYVCGLATDYCVKATALDAKKVGFETFVIIDACRGVDVNKGDVDKAIAEMRDAGIKIITSKEV